MLNCTNTNRHQGYLPLSHIFLFIFPCLNIKQTTFAFALLFALSGSHFRQAQSPPTHPPPFPPPPSSSTMTAALLLPVLFLAMTGHSSAIWCVCKDGVGEANLQKTLDYACGNGADCNPIHSNGPCFNPNTVKAHCNYAVNSYFQRKGQAQGSCDFSGTAAITSNDPSSAGCSYSSSAGGSTGTGLTPTTPVTTTNPSTTTPTIMNPRTNTPTPYGSTTPTGVLGGVGTGLGPSETSTTNTDYSHGGFQIQAISSLTTLVFSGLMLLWG